MMRGMKHSALLSPAAAVLLLSAICGLPSVADSVPAPAPALASAPARAPARHARRRGMPPEAFTTPTNFVYLVNVGGAVDSGWLAEQASSMQRSLQAGVKAVDAPAFTAAADARAVALRFLSSTPDAKLALLVADGADLPPVLASPYEGWALMDAGWVKRGAAASPELERERMGKRVWQTLGALCGAAYRPEREAVMRFSPTPQSLDDCLSHNFHPMNSNSFSMVARAVGLDPVRLRPRAELVELGILKPRPPRPEAAATGTDAPTGPEVPAVPNPVKE